MRRRAFITLIAGSAVAGPLAVHAQPREQKRRVAVLMGGLLPNDSGGQAEVAAFESGLTELGWKLGSNIELTYRWPGAELDQVAIAANEIVAMRPDLVVSRSTPTTAIMMNRGLPIVFVLVTDPLFSTFVQNLGRPGGSVTGFSLFEGSVGGKWLALLKEAAPAISRVSLLFNPETAPFAENYRRSAEAAAPTLGITVVAEPCGNAAHIESAFAARAREGSGGIIGIPDTFINASALLSSDDLTLSSTLRQLNQFGYDVDRLHFVAKDEVELLGRFRLDYDRFVMFLSTMAALIE